MDRKEFGSTTEFRAMLASAPDASGPDYGRSGYLSAVEQATRSYAPR